MTTALQTSTLHPAPGAARPESNQPAGAADDAAGAYFTSLFAAFTNVEATRAQQGTSAQRVAPPSASEERPPRRPDPEPQREASPLRDDRGLAPGSISASPLRADDAPQPPQTAAEPPAEAPVRRVSGRPESKPWAAPGASGANAAAAPAPAASQSLPGPAPLPGQPAGAGQASSPQTGPAPASPASAAVAAGTPPAASIAAPSAARMNAPLGPSAASPGSAPAGTQRAPVQGTSISARAGARAPAAAPSPPPARTTEAVEVQLSRALASALRSGKGGASITLRPESLGTVHVRLDVRDSTVRARIEASTDNAARLLRDAAPALQQALSAKGLDVVHVEVATSSNAQSETMDPGAQGRARDDGAHGRTRADEGPDPGEPGRDDDPRRLIPLTVDSSGAIRVDALV